MLFVFYISKTKEFIKVGTNMKLSKTTDSDKSAYWKSKAAAKTWTRSITSKYPTAKLTRATLKVVED